MTKSKLYSRNLAKSGLFLNLLALIIFISGCSSSTVPTYQVSNIEQSIRDICKNEYKTNVRVKLTGETLWLYIPVEDLFIKADKPEKYLDRYEIEENNVELKGRGLSLKYAIKNIGEKEKSQEVIYNKGVSEKIDGVWKALRRVIFSLERPDNKTREPKFFCLVIADIKNGFETRNIFHGLDLKKASYGFISPDEFQHRNVQESTVEPRVIGDEEGSYLDYADIAMKDFIVWQIVQRIRLKFQKPEVEKNADIDKEIKKIVTLTIKTYGFNDFSEADFYNSITKNRVILNRAAVLAGAIEQKY